MLAQGRGCRYRLSLAERFDCTKTTINQLLADLYKNITSERQVTSCIWWQAIKPPLPSMEKLSMKLAPSTKRVGDHYFIGSNVFIYVCDGRSLQVSHWIAFIFSI